MKAHAMCLGLLCLTACAPPSELCVDTSLPEPIIEILGDYDVGGLPIFHIEEVASNGALRGRLRLLFENVGDVFSVGLSVDDSSMFLNIFSTDYSYGVYEFTFEVSPPFDIEMLDGNEGTIEFSNSFHENQDPPPFIIEKQVRIEYHNDDFEG